MSQKQETPREFWVTLNLKNNQSVDVFSSKPQSPPNEVYEDIHVIEYSAYQEAQAIIEDLRRHEKRRTHENIRCRKELRESKARELKLVEALKKCKGAMNYAYEDHSDQYYLNVKEEIEKALAELVIEVTK